MVLDFLSVPDHLQCQAQEHWQKIADQLNAEQYAAIEAALADKALLAPFIKTLSCSVYLAQLWQKKPDLCLSFLQNPHLFETVNEHYFNQLLTEGLQQLPPGNDIALDAFIRRLRHEQQARFIFRDGNRLCTMQQLTQELSFFADACINAVSAWHYQQLQTRHGTPIGKESKLAQPFVVLAMGKLGAYELNLSSDIDLIFSYPESGDTTGMHDSGKKSIPNQTFFLRLGQKVIKSLDQVTAEGFVFRVDMRLRPYGQSGALALNFDAMELYYEDQGREWERYAMIKARCLSLCKDAAHDLLQRLQPFVYRRYTDFSAIQALRDMKAMINAEVRRLAKQDDVKLGAGGIREIEFIIQAYQLIYGGRDESLQERSVLKVMYLLAEKAALTSTEVESLYEAYVFLRNAEHAIQSLHDQQSQRLPIDPIPQQCFLWHLNFSDWDSFAEELASHRARVRAVFELVVAENQQEEQGEYALWRQIWMDHNQHNFELSLAENGFNEAEVAWIGRLHEEKKLQHLPSISRARLDAFMPFFLFTLQHTQARANVVDGLCDLINAVLRRTTYLVLFNENPHTLQRLIVIAKASPFVMQQLVRQPVLLDELISAEGLGHVPEAQELRESLQQQSLRLAVDDQEQHMQMLRYFKLAHQLHIIVAEATGVLPLMRVSDYLSFVAEAILEYVLQIAWLQMTEKYGFPSRDGNACCAPEFAIIAYGKLGGLELSHSSDLDLVFLYDVDSDGETDGEKSLNNKAFYARMGQRIIHFLTTTTMLGQLYEVDMRLRPSGGKGLLVSTLESFERYQNEEAWTWEHQALVRARAIAGANAVIESFKRIRQQVLTQSRDEAALALDVVKMRRKMFDHLGPKNADETQSFHLKHSRGGIIDIEFMVQFAVLKWAHQFPQLITFSDNIRILEQLDATGIFSTEQCQALNAAYKHYRSAAHKKALKQESSAVADIDIAEQRDTVSLLWQKQFAKTIALIDAQ